MSGRKGAGNDGGAGTKQSRDDVRKCPVCGRPAEPDFRPFCSRRCADVDLSRWLSGAYVIAGRPVDENDED